MQNTIPRIARRFSPTYVKHLIHISGGTKNSQRGPRVIYIAHIKLGRYRNRDSMYTYTDVLFDSNSVLPATLDARAVCTSRNRCTSRMEEGRECRRSTNPAKRHPSVRVLRTLTPDLGRTAEALVLVLLVLCTYSYCILVERCIVQTPRCTRKRRSGRARAKQNQITYQNSKYITYFKRH